MCADIVLRKNSQEKTTEDGTSREDAEQGCSLRLNPQKMAPSLLLQGNSRVNATSGSPEGSKETELSPLSEALPAQGLP